jgi:hypothetical protein
VDTPHWVPGLDAALERVAGGGAGSGVPSALAAASDPLVARFNEAAGAGPVRAGSDQAAEAEATVSAEPGA